MSVKNWTLSSPWEIYVHKLEALFGKDPDINIVFGESSLTVKLFVTGADKAAALDLLLPGGITFGTVHRYILKIYVVPENKEKTRADAVPASNEKTKADLFRDAFDGNPLYSQTIVVQPAVGYALTYVMFNKDVVQYVDETSLEDPDGIVSTLAQDLAREIFSEEDVMYSTESY